MIARERYTTSVDYSDTQPPDTRPFVLSTSAAWINKQPLKAVQNPNASPAQIKAWQNAGWNAFAPQRMSLQALVSHVLAGRAWMPAASDRRKVFKSAQALALDFDNDESGSKPVSIEALKQHPFIARYAAFVYATPSSTPARPKSRVMFMLDEAINTAEGYRAAAAALMDLCADLGPDPACKDEARLFFGSKAADHWIPAAVLPLAVLREHVQDMARAARQKAAAAAPIIQLIPRQAAQDMPHAEKRKRAYAVKALESNAAQIASTPEGGGKFGGRNRAFHGLLCETLNLAYTLPGTISEIEIIDTLSRAARASGLPEDEIEAVKQSALRYPREMLRSIRVNFEDAPLRRSGPPNMQRRTAPTQLSARADNSELRYVPLDEYERSVFEDAQAIEAAAYSDTWPTLADEDAPPIWANEDAAPMDEPPPFFWADDQTPGRQDAQGHDVSNRAHILQYASEIETSAPGPIRADIVQYRSTIEAAAPGSDALSEYRAALPDTWLFAIEDVRSGLVAGLLNALYSLLYRGLIAPWADKDTIKQALTDAGYTYADASLNNAFTAAVKAGFIEAASSKVIFTELQHYKIDIKRESSLCCNSVKTKNARRFYRVLPYEALGRAIHARVFEALIDDFYPHDTESYDEVLAELMTLEDVRSVLTTLKGRRLNSLSALHVWAAIPHTLKAAATGKDDIDAREENARRKGAFFGAIRAIPSLITRKGLIDLGMNAQAAEAAAAWLNQVSGQTDTHGLISLKWSVMLRSYKQRMAALDDMEVTSFTEARLEAKAQMDALRRARVMPHNNRPMTGKAQAERLGVDNRASAVRASKRLGLRREERNERRPLSVKRRGDSPMLIEDIRAAIRAVVKKGEFATMIYSIDERGQVHDSAALEDLEDLRLGVSFAVQVQMASIVHVEVMPQRAERVKAAAQDAQDAQDIEAAPLEPSRQDTRPRRVHRTRLYTTQWLLHNMIAPRIPQRGGQWVHPETGELFEDVRSVLYALIDQTPPVEDAQAAEAVS